MCPLLFWASAAQARHDGGVTNATMAEILVQLEKLERALAHLEQAVAAREKRLLDGIESEKAALRAESEAVSERIDETIQRIQTVLDR